MSFKSIKLLPILLVLGLTTVLVACNNPGEVTAPDDGATEENIVEPESTAEPKQAE